jgi:hypothetical protein
MSLCYYTLLSSLFSSFSIGSPFSLDTGHGHQTTKEKKKKKETPTDNKQNKM